MSGGSYDYVSYRLTDAASTLRARHPNEPHVIALANHLESIALVMHDIEWADSNDTAWNAALDTKIRNVVTPTMELDAALTAARIAYNALAAALERAE